MSSTQMELTLPSESKTARTPSPYPIDQLSAFCRTHPAEPKILFVPSPQVGYNLTTALAAQGVSWVNLRALTPAGLAEELAAPLLQAEGWSPLVQDTDLFFLDDLLAPAINSDPVPFFAPLSHSRGLRRSLIRTFHALRLGGLLPEVLKNATSSRARHLASLYGAYCQRLTDERLYDLAYLYERAIQNLPQEHGCLGREHFYAALDETVLPNLGYRFLKALCGDKIVRIGRAGFQSEPPKDATAVRFLDRPRLEPEGVRVGARFGELSQSTDFYLIRPLGARSEIHAVLREVLQGRIPFDHVEIAYTSERPYLARLYNLTERYDLPATFASGLPVRFTRPGQALVGFYSWILSGFSSAELISLCRARGLDFGEVVQPHDLSALLQRARVRRGRDRVLPALHRLLETDVPDAGCPSRQRILKSIEGLLDLVPPSRTTLKAVCRASVAFLGEFAPLRSDLDARALESLKDRLGEIGRTVKMGAALESVVGHLNGLFGLHKAGASVARPGHLNVVPLDRAGYTARDHLFVLGMDAASFPGRALEDPILPDDERAQLPGELPLESITPDRKVWQLERLLGLNFRSITFLTGSGGPAEGGESYPCAMLGQAAARPGALAGTKIQGITPRLDASLDEVEALLAARDSPLIQERLRLSYPWLVHGREAVKSRDRPELTRFDGWLGRSTPELNISDGRALLSASRLETLTRCPYRYFLKYVLRVAPPDEPDEDPSRWLSPLEFGRLIHDLFRDFMLALKTRNERPDADKHIDLLLSMLREHVSKCTERVPPPSEVTYQTDFRRLERVCQVFLRTESGRSGVEPLDFEVGFGFQEKVGLNQPDPVLLQFSESISLLLRGRIDRIDQVEQGIQIWDYKTGSSLPYPEGDLMRGGLNLQWALYAYAMNQILEVREHGKEVETSGYLFISDREHGRRISAMLPDKSALAQLLEPMFEMVSQGGFFHFQKERQCKFCEYGPICAPEHRSRKHLDETCFATSRLPDLMSSLRRWIDG